MFKINTRNFGWNTIENDLYLCNDALGKYYKMNKVAQDIWNILLENPTCNSIMITDILLNKYDCEKEKLKKDVENFIGQLEKIEAVVII